MSLLSSGMLILMLTYHTRSKYERGFAAYEKNTGSTHPLAFKNTSKHGTGNDASTGDNSQLWYGKISVGTPAVDYTGMFSYALN